jgi:hypothetical protein
VGEWDLEWTGRVNGKLITVPGEWLFFWALDGRAVQDVWIVPSREERRRGRGDPGEYGTTIRFSDPQIDAWRVSWTGPAYGKVRLFTARQQGDQIVLEGAERDGQPLRWIFFDITADTFRWRSVVSGDGGETWAAVEEQRAQRRTALPAPENPEQMS